MQIYDFSLRLRHVILNFCIVIGCVLTTAALSYGLYQMKVGNSRMSQRMMRLRIAAQGCTIVACLAGAFYAAKRNKTKT